jgi:UDP-N-acetyl-D-mannosaminuronic acid dehydrogenase
LYASFCAGKILLTDSRTAEMCKLTENACRDVNIAFANELSLICDRLDVDVWELIELANHHPRVKVLQPGPGVGGHCIAVDPWFLAHAAPDAARLIRTAREVNDSKPDFILKKIEVHAAKFKSPTVACLGLAFKANVDDLRESPALEITKRLAEKKIARVLAVEPYVEALPKSLQNAGVTKAELNEAIRTSDIVVLLVNHREFLEVDRAILKEKVVIDTRGAWR